MINTRIRLKIDTTANWDRAITFIPYKGEVIVYSDYATKTVDGSVVYIPNFKVGDGLAYVPDLPFVTDDMRATLSQHLLDTTAHLTEAERLFWNQKVRCYMGTKIENNALVENEELIFTTN